MSSLWFLKRPTEEFELRYASSGARLGIPASNGRQRKDSRLRLTVATMTVGGEFPHVATVTTSTAGGRTIQAACHG